MFSSKTRLFIIISAVGLSTASAFSQERCVEFKHAEFFVPAGAKIPNWPEAELPKLIGANVNTDDRMTFVIPFIVKQLAEYEPACGALPVDRRFELLVQLYSAIRPHARPAASLPTGETLQSIRKDFYKQLNDDAQFRDLIYTMDDGPLMGRVASISAVKALNSREFRTHFGKIRFANTGKGVAVIAIDNRGKSLWSRLLGGVVPKRPLRNANLKSLTVELTDFVIVARLFVDGERLTLYTRPNGRFMYYTHSW